MNVKWTGDQMWAFGPAARIVQNHLSTFAESPRRGALVGNEQHVNEQVSSDTVFSQ